MQLVDQAGAQILPDGGYAAAEADVAAVRCSARLLQGGVNAFGDKAKLRTSRHPERRPRVMREHEDRHVIRRLLAPPALPALVRPRAPDWTEHVAPENPGTDSGKALLGNSVVDSRLSIGMAVHLPPHAPVEEPLQQLGAPDAERILEILDRPGAVAVDGNREALDAERRLWHALCYLFSGGMLLIEAENCAWTTRSTGLCFTFVLAGSLPRKLSSFQFLDGLTGLGTNPPPQLGQTLLRTASTQVAQNVHS